jgi:hypothetical protein
MTLMTRSSGNGSEPAGGMSHDATDGMGSPKSKKLT